MVRAGMVDRLTLDVHILLADTSLELYFVFGELRSGDVNWCEFWNQARSEEWGPHLVCEYFDVFVFLLSVRVLASLRSVAFFFETHES